MGAMTVPARADPSASSTSMPGRSTPPPARPFPPHLSSSPSPPLPLAWMGAMKVPPGADLSASSTSKPGRSTPLPARLLRPWPHLSLSPSPNPDNQRRTISPGRSAPQPASAPRPVATSAPQTYASMAEDPVEKLIYEFNNIRLFLIDPDRSMLYRLVNQICDPASLCSLPPHDILLVFQSSAEVHGRSIARHINQMVSTIIRIMSSVAGSSLVDGCSKVIHTLSRYVIDPLGTEEEKSGFISSLCSPFAACLMSTKESVSSGSALCITALIQSNNWQFASRDLVNHICLKVSGALEEVHCQTIEHLSLVIALTKQKQLKFGHWQPLIRSGLGILVESTKAHNSEMAIASIEMVQSIVKTLDLGIMSYEIGSIVEAMEQLQERLCFLIDVYDILLELKENDRGSFEAVMQELKGEPLHSDWQQLVNDRRGNGYLNETFKYRKERVGVDYENDPEGLLQMLRNSRQHSAKFKEAEFSRIVAEHYPHLLSDLQLALHRQKKLSNLNLRYSMV
ncbi:hypothetical protein ZWY2020_030221 [Hordeum vulgare]|nr:hypothetical protein ZWY2020_030221 [Hordeum vulgare]